MTRKDATLILIRASQKYATLIADTQEPHLKQFLLELKKAIATIQENKY